MNTIEKFGMDDDVLDITSPKTENLDQLVAPLGGEENIFIEGEENYGRPDLSQTIPMAKEENAHIDSQYLNEDVEPGKTKIGKTPNGKTVQVYKLMDRTGYGINFSEGGELPVEFQGIWTAYSKAELDARLYLQRRWDEFEKNGTTEAR